MDTETSASRKVARLGIRTAAPGPDFDHFYGLGKIERLRQSQLPFSTPTLNEDSTMDPASFAVGVIPGVIGILLLTVGLKILAPWLRLKMRGGKGSLAYVLAIHLRGNSPTLLIDAYTNLLHAGKETSLREIEIFYVAHGHKVSTSAELISLIHQSEDSKLSS